MPRQHPLLQLLQLSASQQILPLRELCSSSRTVYHPVVLCCVRRFGASPSPFTRVAQNLPLCWEPLEGQPRAGLARAGSGQDQDPEARMAAPHGMSKVTPCSKDGEQQHGHCRQSAPLCVWLEGNYPPRSKLFPLTCVLLYVWHQESFPCPP